MHARCDRAAFLTKVARRVRVCVNHGFCRISSAWLRSRGTVLVLINERSVTNRFRVVQHMQTVSSGAVNEYLYLYFVDYETRVELLVQPLSFRVAIA